MNIFSMPSGSLAPLHTLPMLGGLCIFCLPRQKAETCFLRLTCSQGVGIQRCSHESPWFGKGWRQRHGTESILVRMAEPEGELPAFRAAVAEVLVGESHGQHWPREQWCSGPAAGAVWWHTSCLQAWFSHCSRDPVSSPNIPQYIPFCLPNQNGCFCN